jgi:hypothetical protein
VGRPIVSGPAGALYAIALLDGALRITSAERRAAEAELNEVERGSKATISWANGFEASLRAAAKEDASEWVDALSDLFAGLDSSDDDEAIAALGRIQRRIGSRPAFADVEGFLAACQSAGPIVLGASAVGRRRSGPTRSVLAGTLGDVCAPPVSGLAAAVLAGLLSDRRKRWIRGHAGLHLAVKREGALYQHHGVYLGDGTVVHFAGEGLSQKSARVERTSLREFVAREGLKRTYSLRPTRMGGEPVATLDPAVICLRALSRVGDTGYQLVQNNCEHLSVWSQIGASVSFQVQRARTLVPGKTQMHEAVAIALDQRLRLIGELVPGDLLLGARDESYPIDLARAYWSRDRKEIVTWFPLWSPAFAPIGEKERAWSIGRLGVDVTWHDSPPALELDSDWHASLIAFGDCDSYWLTSDGVWIRPICDLLDVVARRLDSTQALVEALVAPPSRLAQVAANLAENVKD